MPTMSEYFERLKALVPGRTLALYMLGTTLALGVADKAEDVAQKFPWLILFIAGLSIAFNVIGGFFLDKKNVVPVLLSSSALLLFMASQRFVGPLAVFGVDTQPVFVVVALLSAVLISVAPVIYKGDINRPPTPARSR
jgi:hypothetical protein